jgi:hypothetical protein
MEGEENGNPGWPQNRAFFPIAKKAGSGLA